MSVVFNGSGGSGGGASDLDDLTDVVITTPADKHVLVHDGTEWENRQLASTDLSNVSEAVGTADGDMLVWDNVAGEFEVHNKATVVADLELVPGTDIPDYAFKTIAVSGQSNIVAEQPTDTLTFAAGSNVTITTDAGTDTITIAASGGGGSTPAGSVSPTAGRISAHAKQGVSNLGMTANREYYIPFYHDGATTVNSLKQYVSGVAGSTNFKMAIYEVGSDGNPSNRLFASGAMNLTAAGVITASLSSMSLPQGWYFIGIISDATPNISATDLVMSNPLGFDGTSLYRMYGYKAGSYASGLPNPASTGLSYETTHNAAFPTPMIGG